MKLLTISISAMVLLITTSPSVLAGHRARSSCSGGQCARQVGYSLPATATVAHPATYGYAHAQDTIGFVGWLNRFRASRGLRPVAWSNELAADAARNSALGFGHNFLGRARLQNVGWGPLSTIQDLWVNDPPHSWALLSEQTTLVGLANVAGVWTYNGN